MTQFNCPYCGRPIQAVKAGGSPWSVEPTYFSNYGDRTNHRFGDVAEPASVPQFSRAERRTPSRVPTKESDVWVPAFKALLTGALIGLPAGVACAVAWELPWWSPLAVASVTTGGAWLLFLARSEGTLWIIEKIINQDVTGDGQIGKPEPEPITAEVKWEDQRGQYRRMQFVDVFSPDVLKATPSEGIMDFVRAAVAGDSLSEADWTGSGRPFGQRTYRRMMNTLEGNGLLERDGLNRNAPRQLSLAGKAVFRRILERGL